MSLLSAHVNSLLSGMDGSLSGALFSHWMLTQTTRPHPCAASSQPPQPTDTDETEWALHVQLRTLVDQIRDLQRGQSGRGYVGSAPAHRACSPTSAANRRKGLAEVKRLRLSRYGSWQLERLMLSCSEVDAGGQGSSSLSCLKKTQTKSRLKGSTLAETTQAQLACR